MDEIKRFKRKKQYILAGIVILFLVFMGGIAIKAAPSSLVTWQTFPGSLSNSNDKIVFYISDQNRTTTYRYEITGLYGHDYGSGGDYSVVDPNSLHYGTPTLMTSASNKTFEAPTIQSITLYATGANGFIQRYGHYDSNGNFVDDIPQVTHDEFLEGYGWSRTELQYTDCSTLFVQSVRGSSCW